MPAPTDAPSFPDRQRRRLGSDFTRGALAGAGWPHILFGLPFMAAGVFIILVSMDVVKAGRKNAPDEIVALFGCLFAGAGLFVSAKGFRASLQQRLARQRRRRHPDEPWLADHAWDPTGRSDDSAGRARRTLLGALVLASSLVPFNAFAAWSRHPVFVAVIGVFDVVVLLMLTHAGYLVLRLAKYGTTRLRFEAFPFRLGGPLDAVLELPRGLGAYESISFTLRCIEEVEETTGSGKNRSTRLVRWQLYADQYVFAAAGRYEAGSAPVAVTFLLPADQPSTCLAARLPVYWEIEVRAPAPGVDFAATYLVPVYGASAGAGVLQPTANPA